MEARRKVFPYLVQIEQESVFYPLWQSHACFTTVTNILQNKTEGLLRFNIGETVQSIASYGHQ